MVISKPTAFSLFQLVWHFLKRFGIFYEWFGIFCSLEPGNPKQEGCVKLLRKVKVTTPPYSCRGCFVIYETAVICRRIGWFPVFCARASRTNGGGYAKVLNFLPF